MVKSPIGKRFGHQFQYYRKKPQKRKRPNEKKKKKKEEEEEEEEEREREKFKPDPRPENLINHLGGSIKLLTGSVFIGLGCGWL